MDILSDSYDLEKYKDILIRNWKQHCERKDDFLLDSDNYNEVFNRYTFLLSDRNVKNLFESLGNRINMEFMFRYSFNKRKGSKAEKSNISLYHYKTKFKIDSSKFYDKKEKEEIKKSWFSSKSKSISYNKYELKEIYKDYGITDKDIYGNVLEIETHFLIFNNIIVPISAIEGRDLLEYEKECRRKDDLAEIYQNSTFIPFDEYRDFVEWRKTMKEEKEKDFSIMEEESK
jgi:hypothetical protein